MAAIPVGDICDEINLKKNTLLLCDTSIFGDLLVVVSHSIRTSLYPSETIVFCFLQNCIIGAIPLPQFTNLRRTHIYPSVDHPRYISPDTIQYRTAAQLTRNLCALLPRGTVDLSFTFYHFHSHVVSSIFFKVIVLCTNRVMDIYIYVHLEKKKERVCEVRESRFSW